ncbi:MAG: MlaD family protein, partial [Rhodococcus sp. (in: high G+C Gram-positive bacteria)]|uniref:MCE family protein n=1 Tax=Rhodococcus sp. TaxID=1831 RepID=UPI003BB06E3A
MVLTRFVRIQLMIFSVLTVIAVTVMGVQYMQIPSLVGIGRYELKVQLPATGGLYRTSNVTYRGVTVGKVEDLQPSPGGIEATLSMVGNVKIPADLDADVHSRSAIGEQYVDLVPRTSNDPYLEDGDTIPLERTSVPQDVGPLIDTVNRGLEAIPQQNLQTVIDESYYAFNGTGPVLQRLFDSAHLLARDSVATLAPMTQLITDAEPVLAASAASSESIRSWARSLNEVTSQLAVK